MSNQLSVLPSADEGKGEKVASLTLFGGRRVFWGVRRGAEMPPHDQDRDCPYFACRRWLGTGPATGRDVLCSSA